MRLFENGVGRPSNEIKRKRKIFVICAITICIALISVFALVLTKNGADKLQGAAQKPLTLTCQASRTVGNPVTCYVTSYGKAVTGAKVSVSDSSIATIKNVNSNKYEVTFNEKIFTKYAKQVKNKNKKNYINAKISASKYGYKTATDYAEIYEKEKITLNCPSAVWTNKEFKCTTNLSGVKITVGKANSLAKDYDSSQMMLPYDKNAKFKYTNKIFENYKNLVVNEYNFANTPYLYDVITASKKGYQPVTKKVMILRNSDNNKLSIYCPDMSFVDQKFVCLVNQEDVKISLGGANSLVSGYEKGKTTSIGNYTINIKYTNKLFTNYKNIIKKDSYNDSYINAQVTAKKGKNTITRNVKIYKNNYPRTLDLKCSKDRIVIGEKNTCTTNQAMVRLAVTNTDAITTGYSTSFITSSNSKANTLTFEFTDKLFQNNPAEIQKDSLGNEYIIVGVSADKIGTSIVGEVVGISIPIMVYRNTIEG